VADIPYQIVLKRDRDLAGREAATLKLHAPPRVRSGVLYEARFHVSAQRDLKRATLLLGPSWVEGMTLNTIEPSPAHEASANGQLSFELGHIPAGGSYILFLEFRTNPTNVGHRSAPEKLIEKNLTRERMTEDEVAEEMRSQQIGSLDEVQWAILEANGSVSFIKSQ
jgi:Protein of unknown function (DUF421)